MKEISFHLTKDKNIYAVQPSPASQDLPEWYKKSNIFFNDEKKYRMIPRGSSNTTYKKCVPFLESMISGYHLYLNDDIFVDPSGNSEFLIQWRGEYDIVDAHHLDQTKGLTFDTNYYHENVFKFNNPYLVRTPPGYSCLFTHPLNRPDLPFLTLSGVVDTDKYEFSLNFTFLLRRDFSGILPAGTPMVQIIPFRRNNWKMNIGKYLDITKARNYYYSIAHSYYRKTTWSRKTYK